MTKEEINAYVKRLNDYTRTIMQVEGFPPTTALEVAHDILIIDAIKSNNINSESIKKYLKENLKVKLYCERQLDTESLRYTHLSLKVSLYLGDEEISSTSKIIKPE